MNLLLTVETGFGSLAPQYFVTAQPGEELISQTSSMMTFMATVATITSIPAMLLARSKPKSPPSDEVAAERYPFLKSLKDLFGKKNTVLYLVGVGCIYATMTTSSFIFQAQFTPFGLTETSASTAFALSNIVSPPFYFLAAGLIKIMGGYKKAILLLSVLWSISNFAQIPVSYTENVLLISIYYIYLTCLSRPQIAISLEYVVELSFPVGETAAGGMLTLASQQISSLTAFICGLVLDNSSQIGSVYSYIILGGFASAGTILLFFVKDSNNRSDFLKRNSEEDSMNNISKYSER